MTTVNEIIEKTIAPTNSYVPRPWVTHKIFRGSAFVVKLNRSGNLFSLQVGSDVDEDDRVRPFVRIRTTKPSAATPSMIEGDYLEELTKLTAEAMQEINAYLVRQHEEYAFKMMHRETNREAYQGSHGQQTRKTGKTEKDRNKKRQK